MIFLTKEEDFILSDNHQALYFYASWMPYHNKMMKMIDKVENIKNIQFIAIDVDFFKSFIKRFKIDSIPTVLLFFEGKEIKRVEGLVLTSAFKSAFVDI